MLQICQAVLGPTVSLSADLWGRKPFMMVGLALGAIGAIVTATSHHAYVALIGEYTFRAYRDSGCPALDGCRRAISAISSSSRRLSSPCRRKIPLTFA
jgi:MFS family permease